MKSRRAFITGPISKFKNIFQENNKDADIVKLYDHSIRDFSSDEFLKTNSLISDFPLMDLQMELMRLGIDPSNMNREQMLEIVHDEMKHQKIENEREININKKYI